MRSRVRDESYLHIKNINAPLTAFDENAEQFSGPPGAPSVQSGTHNPELLGAPEVRFWPDIVDLVGDFAAPLPLAIYVVAARLSGDMAPILAILTDNARPCGQRGFPNQQLTDSRLFFAESGVGSWFDV